MNEQIVKPKRVRGKGKRPALAHVNLRLPIDVVDYFQQLPNYTGKMREVLTEYVRNAKDKVTIIGGG
jgi:uncharacterized protein (DUF4415 family)